MIDYMKFWLAKALVEIGATILFIVIFISIGLIVITIQDYQRRKAWERRNKR